MKKLLLFSGLLASAGTARDLPPGAPLVAADRAMAEMARDKGEWTAFRAVADPRGELLVPERVKIREFGRDLPDPPQATRWQPDNAWIACDGSAGVTEGRWRLPGKGGDKGRYLAVWVRKGDGTYRLLLRHARTAAQLKTKPPGRKGHRAACTGKPDVPLRVPVQGADFKLGAAHDQSLIWSSAVLPGGSVEIEVRLWDGTAHQPVLALGQSPARQDP